MWVDKSKTRTKPPYIKQSRIHAGALFDWRLLAAVAVFLQTKFPRLTVDPGGIKSGWIRVPSGSRMKVCKV